MHGLILVGSLLVKKTIFLLCKGHSAMCGFMLGVNNVIWQSHSSIAVSRYSLLTQVNPVCNLYRFNLKLGLLCRWGAPGKKW